MEKNNLSLLRENLRYLGFGESEALNERLELLIQSRPILFDLSTEAHFDEWSKMTAVICFRWSEALEVYSLVKYEASLNYDDDPGNDITHSFPVVKGSGVTFKEAFNLLEGRAVNKDFTDDDGKKYNAWIQLDLHERTPTGNYKERKYRIEHGYDLEKILHTYPIRELQDEALKENLIRSLKKGNLHPVTFVKANKVEIMYIEANPQFKTIGICSEMLREVYHLTSKRKRNEKEGTN